MYNHNIDIGLYKITSICAFLVVVERQVFYTLKKKKKKVKHEQDPKGRNGQSPLGDYYIENIQGKLQKKASNKALTCIYLCGYVYTTIDY
jgi:hypothetical protein